jgi:hypothetical protein
MRDYVHPLEFFAFSARHGIGVGIGLRPIFGKPVGANTDIDKSLRLGVAGWITKKVIILLKTYSVRLY